MKKFLYIGVIAMLFLLSTASIVLIPQPKSDWTVTTLKEYFEGRLDAIQLAVTKAEQATEKRFESVNEFRSSLADQNRTFMPRSEAEAQFESLNSRIISNDEAIKKMQNMKQGGNVVWAYVIGGFGMIFGIISLMLNLQKKGIK